MGNMVVMASSIARWGWLFTRALIRNRPLIIALVAFGQAVYKAGLPSSVGGRYIDVAERQPINAAFWGAYDKAVQK